jgi:hypothetical protein
MKSFQTSLNEVYFLNGKEFNMRIYDYMDNYIEEFVQNIRNSDGKIKKTEIYKKFTERYPDFAGDIFDKESLEKYLIDEVSFYTGVDFIEEDNIMNKTDAIEMFEAKYAALKDLLEVMQKHNMSFKGYIKHTDVGDVINFKIVSDYFMDGDPIELASIDGGERIEITMNDIV